MPPGFPVIDAAASGNQVFQITLNIDHTVSAEGAEKLLKSAGFINDRGTRSEKCLRKKGKKPAILEFYWLVHRSRYAEWCKKAPKSFTSTNIELTKCWNENVVQYALELSTKGPDPKTLEELDQSASLSTVTENFESTAHDIGNIGSACQSSMMGTSTKPLASASMPTVASERNMETNGARAQKRASDATPSKRITRHRASKSTDK
jgi:hypothetical protein